MSRNYENTGATQNKGGLHFMRVHGKLGHIVVDGDGQKITVPGFSGFIDGFEYFSDPGNPDHKIRPHEGIKIFLSGRSPITGEVQRHQLTVPLNTTIVGPNIMNALLGEEENIDGDTNFTLSVWLNKTENIRCKVEINGKRPANKYPWSDALSGFEGVPVSQKIQLPNGDWMTDRRDATAFWYKQAQEFVQRMSGVFAGAAQFDDSGFDEDDEDPGEWTDPSPTVAPAATPPPAEPTPEPPKPAAPGKESITNVELTKKLTQVGKLTQPKDILTAWANMRNKYDMNEGQINMAKAKFALAAGSIGMQVEFEDLALKEVKKEAPSDYLPF